MSGLGNLLFSKEEKLMDAAIRGDKAEIENLLSKGAKVDLRDTKLLRNSTKALFGKEYKYITQAYENLKALEFFIRMGADINAKDNEGWTALHKAALAGKKEVVEFLLSKGADIGASGWMPLHTAACGNKEAVELLLSKGADIDAKDNNGWMPLHRAARHGNKEVVELLLSKGADINAKDNNGKTAIDTAKQAGNIELANFLLSKVVATDDVIKIAIENMTGMIKNISSFQFLSFTSIGILIIIFRRKRRLQLPIAAKKGDKETVIMLLSRGVKVDLEDIELVEDITRTLFGEAYKNIAESAKNMRALEFFLRVGADVKAKDENGITPLHTAAYSGNKEIVEFLLSKGVNVNAKDNSGKTALHQAVAIASKEIIELLLSKGTDINAKDKNGVMPIHTAAHSGNKEIVEFLLSKGANINMKDNDGKAALHFAALSRNEEVVEFLLSKGLDIDAKTNDGKTAMHLAAQKGNKEVVELLLSRGVKVELNDIELVKDVTQTLFSKVYKNIIEATDSIKALQFFIEMGADINVKDEIGTTPLHMAAYFGNEEVVEFLLSKGLDIDAKANNGKTAMHLAAQTGNKEVVELLLSRGVKVELNDIELVKDVTQTLFSKVYKNIIEATDSIKALQFFIEMGADINVKDEIGTTPLHMAAYFGNEEVVEFLLSKGLDIDAKTNDGKTAMHLAAQKGNKEVVELLLSRGVKVELNDIELVKDVTQTLFSKVYKNIIEATDSIKALQFFIEMGADINVKDEIGTTPLHMAAYFGNEEVVEFLLSKGLDIDAKANDGVTPLHLSAKKGKKEVVELLFSKGAKVDFSDAQLVGNITKTLFEKEYTHITHAYENLKALEFFIKKGADINTKTNNGKTALHLAAEKGEKEIIAYLLSKGAYYQRELFTTPQEYRDAKQDIIVCFKNTVLPLKYKPTEDSLVLLGYKKEQQIINDLITTLAVKAALKLPDAKCELMLVDPVGLGKNCNLLYNLDKKFYQKISTTKQDVENLLSSLESYASYVHSNYLKGVYDSLAAYNHDNKEVSEATKFVIVYDYFKATDDEQKKRFQKLFGEARSVGINFILSYDIENESEAVKNIQDATTLKIESNLVTFSDDCILSVEKIMDTIGYLNGKLAKLDDVKVSYIKNKPKELWSKDSSSFIEANIGKSGRESLMFAINNQMESHALLIGRSGSGKSNLLHIMISDLVLNYSPQDIKLYLVDMKGGTEFVKYTQAGLPHLEIASITSDREMALTILKRVEGKLNEREKLFSSQGVQNIEQYNTKFAQNKEPRLLLILDEFQELFTKEDSIKREAAEIFDRVSKKGRSFGINMILASQSLGGDTLAASTVNQFAIRIVLQCSEDDSRRVLSFDNSEAKLLSKPGEGIYNAQNGSVAGNQKFQTYWLETQEHDALLQEVSAFANEKSVETQCVVFREDLVPSFIDSYKKSSFEKSKKEIVFGQPYGFSDYVSLKLKKDDAANVLISGNSQELADQVMILFLLSLALDASSKKRFYILSSGDEEENQLQEYAQVLKSCNVLIDFITKRNALEIFGELNQEIQNCIDNDVKMEVENYLFIDNGYKMRVLRKESDEYGGSKISQETSLLSSILKNGPEFGVHSFVYIESIKQFDMMFDYTTLKHDFNNIIALQMSEDDAQRLIGNYKASSLGQSNAIFVVDDTNTEVKFRPLALPPHSWVEHTLA